MKITIDPLGWNDSQARIRLESENHAEVAALVILGKRIKKAVKTYGFIMKDRTVLDIRLPMRKQKSSDDEFGNQ